MLGRLRNLKFMIVGDAILDVWITGLAKGIAQESFTPVMEISNPQYTLGGACNVANIIANENDNTTFITVVGQDNSAENINNLMERGKVKNYKFLIDESKRTSTKIRINDQQHTVMRLDNETNEDVNLNLQQQLVKIISETILENDVILLSDYAKGVLTELVIRKTIELSRKYGKKIFADIKPSTYTRYKNSYFVKMNIQEFCTISKCDIDDMVTLKMKAEQLRKELEIEHFLITMGHQGMLYLNSSGIEKIDAHSVLMVESVVGAGDWVLALVAMCDAVGLSMDTALRIANYGAAIKIQSDFQKHISIYSIFYDVCIKNLSQKCITSEKFIELLPAIDNKKIVFTNGCFDVLHPGHILLLSESKKLGDILVVGINTDNSIKKLKGNNRPIIPLNDRVMQLSALSFVDFIIPFAEDTPLQLIQQIKPNVLTKGSDYTINEIVGTEFVISCGGKVVIIDKYFNYSSTNIIEKKYE